MLWDNTKFPGGQDTTPLGDAGVPTMELMTADEKYFWYHHSEADTIDKLNADELGRCAASIASMVYVVADFEEALNQMEPYGNAEQA